jgi:hypothetical protein
MIGYGDDAKVMELLAPLRRLEPLTFSDAKRSAGRRLRRPVLAAAVVAVALGLVGVAIADGFGAFNGIRAAQEPQTPAALRWAKQFQSLCAATPSLPSQPSAYFPSCHLVLASARLLSPDSNVYVVTDTRGDLCVSIAFGGGCGAPLSQSQPITAGGANPSPTDGGELTIGGVALDGVNSVSFTIPLTGQAVTVPVKHNVWVYRQADSHASGEIHCVVAHMADGSSVNPFPEVPCP